MANNHPQPIANFYQLVRAHARTVVVILACVLAWPRLAWASDTTDDAIETTIAQGVHEQKALLAETKQNTLQQQSLRHDLAIIDDRLSQLTHNVTSRKKDISSLDGVTSTELKQSLLPGLADLREQLMRDEREIERLKARSGTIITELTALEAAATTLTARSIAADNAVKARITALAQREVTSELSGKLQDATLQTTGRAVCATTERLSDCKQRALQHAQTEASQRGTVAAIQSLSASHNGKLSESRVYRSVKGIILEQRITHEGWESDGQTYAVHIEATVRPQVPPEELAQLVAFRAQRIASRTGSVWSEFDYAAGDSVSAARPQSRLRPALHHRGEVAKSADTATWSETGLWGTFGLGFHHYELTAPPVLSMRAGYTSTELAAGYYSGPNRLAASLSDSSQNSTHSAQAIPLAFDRLQFAIQYSRLLSPRLGLIAGYLSEVTRFDNLSGRKLTHDKLSTAGPFTGAFARWRPTSTSTITLEFSYALLDSRWKLTPDTDTPAKAQGSSLRLSYSLQVHPTAKLHVELRTRQYRHRAAQEINEHQDSVRVTYERRF